MRFTRRLLAATFAALFSGQLAAAPIVVRVQAAAEPNLDSAEPAVSADGKTVVFTSVATNLAAAGAGNLFSYDVRADSVRALTTSIDGQALAPAVSATGRYVAFETNDNELGDGIGTGAGNDVLRLDTQTGVYLRASRALNPALPASASSGNPAISGDGRYVAFTSQATNFVQPAPTGNLVQVYEMDMETRALSMVSRGGDGAQGNSNAFALENNAYSRDGNLLVFATDATNLAAVNAGNVSDALLRRIDRASGTVTFENLNRSAQGVVGNLSSSVPSLSPNGRFAIFLSTADNLLPAGRSGSRFYVRDLAANTLRGLALPPDMGSCTRGRIDDNGDAVLFCQPAAPNPPAQQLFRVPANGAAVLLSRAFAGAGAANRRTGADFSVSADGRMVVTESVASNLIPDDGNGDGDVFMIAEAAIFDELFRDGFE
jgi:Tol biopolymer transport system component